MDKKKMININASLLEEPVFSSFEKDGEEVKVEKEGYGNDNPGAKSQGVKHLMAE